MKNMNIDKVKNEPLTAKPLIVMSAPNGARLTHKDHVNLPITPKPFEESIYI